MKNYFKPHIVELSYPGTSKVNNFYIRKLGFMSWLYYDDFGRSWCRKAYGTCAYSTLTASVAGLNKVISAERYKKALKNPKIVQELW